MFKELLIGCGNARDKRFSFPGRDRAWSNLTTLDNDPNCGADVLHDLSVLPLPFQDNEFDEIHAYEVLEHIGNQGDHVAFFAQFSEFWRILKPGGLFLATVPSLKAESLWADPGHKRAISYGSLMFLSQDQYVEQVGKTHMTDYRNIYKADFAIGFVEDDGINFAFILRAIKNGGVNG